MTVFVFLIWMISHVQLWIQAGPLSHTVLYGYSCGYGNTDLSFLMVFFSTSNVATKAGTFNLFTDMDTDTTFSFHNPQNLDSSQHQQNPNMCKPSYDLRVSTHLNNIGVLLLQKGAYQQAAKTLREALAVLKAGAAPQQISSAAICQTFIQNAARRLSNPRTFLSHGCQPIKLSVLSDMDDCPTRFLRTRNTSCVVRMESFEFEEPTENDLRMAASILFLNSGIAYKCLSSASCFQHSFREAWARQAMKLFRLAHAALANWQVDPKVVTTEFQRRLLIQLLALQQLVELSQQLGTEEGNSQDLASRLDSLRVKVSRMAAMKNISPLAASAA